MRLRVNVDMDGVLYEFHKVAQGLAWEATGVLPEEPHEWNMGIANFDELFPDMVANGVFRHGQPVNYAYQGVKALVDAGHDVRIVTHKVFEDPHMTKWAVTDASAWLTEYGFLALGVDLVFTNGFGKQAFPAHVVIDDKPTLEWTQANARLNILYAQPWNRTVNQARQANHRVVRIADWRQIAEVVNTL